MLHARADYNQIQDPSGKIPEDEPVFLLRAQDMNAPATARFWAKLAKENGASDDIVQKVLDWADVMGEWQHRHGFKIPDIPKGA